MAKPTKYAAVVKNLPKFPGDDPGRLELLGKVRDEILATLEPTDYNVDAQIFGRLDDVQKKVESILVLGKRVIGVHRNAAAFTNAYVVIRTIVDTLGDLKSATQLLLDAYERLMTDQMEAEGMRSLNLESGGGVTTYEEPCGKVVDKEAFRLWCVAPSDRCMVCGAHADDLVHHGNNSNEHVPHEFKPGGGYEKQLQLWPSSMNAVVKERALNAEPAPDGVEVYAKTIVRVSRS